MTTVQKTKKLISYLKNTKKVETLNFLCNGECEDWFFYFDLSGYFNNSYFAIQISNHKLHNYDEIKIINTTDNVVEINNLLAKHGLKNKI